MNNFSPNMLKTFEQCQMKFFFKYVQKISIPQRTKFFEKGKKIHALANYHLQNQNIERMEKTLSVDEKLAWDALKSNKYFNLEVYSTEYNLSCKVFDWWIGGRLDALVRDGDNYFILDYKTGNIPQNAQDDFQTVVYLLCVDKFLKHKKIHCSSLQFVYLGLKNGEEKVIALTDGLRENYEDKVKSICQKIDFTLDSQVFKKNMEACRNCEYSKICDI